MQIKQAFIPIVAVIIAVIILALYQSGKDTVDSMDSETPMPAIVFDMGGKFDKSFNQSAYEGAERFKQDNNADYLEFEVTNETQREQALNRFAQRGGNPVVGIGFAQAPAVAKVAERYPDQKFAIIDGVVEGEPNVRSIVFKEHEGSFLVGMVAALKSDSDVVGFVGGMDIPLIRKFACGYAQGARYVNPEVTVIVNMTGNDASAWNNPSRGSELAFSQFERDADVVFAAAGGTGLGVYQAAKDNGKFAIGVDSNQNYLYPGTMLTSMVKRVDVAVYKAFSDASTDNFSTGIVSLGLADDGVDWALDEYNRDLITASIEQQVNAAKADIVKGNIQVHDYSRDNSCPQF